MLQMILSNFLLQILGSVSQSKPKPPKLISIDLSRLVPIAENEAEEPVVPAMIEPEPAAMIAPPAQIQEPATTETEPAKLKTETTRPAAKAKPRPMKKVIKKSEVKKPIKTEPASVELSPKPVAPNTPVQSFQPPAAVIAEPVTETSEAVSKPATTHQIAKKSERTQAVSSDAFNRYLASVFRAIERSKKYPSAARRRNISGRVNVRFSINRNGRAEKIEITQKAPHELESAAIELLKSQRFDQPPTDWNPGSRIDFVINYSLK